MNATLETYLRTWYPFVQTTTDINNPARYDVVISGGTIAIPPFHAEGLTDEQKSFLVNRLAAEALDPEFSDNWFEHHTRLLTLRILWLRSHEVVPVDVEDAA
jgi:hypothetical protein